MRSFRLVSRGVQVGHKITEIADGSHLDSRLARGRASSTDEAGFPMRINLFRQCDRKIVELLGGAVARVDQQHETWASGVELLRYCLQQLLSLSGESIGRHPCAIRFGVAR